MCEHTQINYKNLFCYWFLSVYIFNIVIISVSSPCCIISVHHSVVSPVSSFVTESITFTQQRWCIVTPILHSDDGFSGWCLCWCCHSEQYHTNKDQEKCHKVQNGELEGDMHTMYIHRNNYSMTGFKKQVKIIHEIVYLIIFLGMHMYFQNSLIQIPHNSPVYMVVYMKLYGVHTAPYKENHGYLHDSIIIKLPIRYWTTQTYYSSKLVRF